MSVFLGLPNELFLLIVACIDVEDILSLRKTCRTLYQSTKAGSLWIDILHRQQFYLPLPRGARASDDLTKYSPSELELIARKASKADRDWFQPRGDDPHSLRSRGDSIVYIELFLDRWLVVVYGMSIVGIWDIERRSDKLCTSLQLSGGMCMSSIASYDSREHAIIVAITGSYRTSLFRIRLDKIQAHAMRFEEIMTTQVSPVEIVRALCPDLHLAAFSRSNFIDVLDWNTNRWLAIPTNSEELDELAYQWNGVVALKFCSNHILCVKARSIEVYPLPPISRFSDPPFQVPNTDRSAYDLQSAKLFLPETTFRGVSISSMKLEPKTSVITTTLIAYDVLKGLFHLRVTVNMPEVSPTLGIQAVTPAPRVMIELIGVHNMMRDHNPYPLLQGEGSGHNSPLDNLLQTGNRLGVTRGFVSACCLGPEGRRGIWVERTRNSTKRAVFAFSVDPSKVQSVPISLAFPGHTVGITTDGDAQVDGEHSDSDESSASDFASIPWIDVPHIAGSQVFVVNSYDLREDITHCTFSEVSGRIVLGTRDGSLKLL